MGTYGAFKTNAELEKRGIRFDLGSAGKFDLARAGGANTAFAKRFEALTKPHRRAIQTGTLDEEVASGILAQVYAEQVVRGWEGVTDENGNELAFTTENCIKLLKDLPDLFSTLRQCAEDASAYRDAVREADSGN